VQRFVDFAGVLNDDVEDNEDRTGFTMDNIKDTVVAERTTSSYIGNIYIFLQFCLDATIAPYNSVVTDVGRKFKIVTSLSRRAVNQLQEKKAQ
jgi:hypothetical protein